jgi:hypothetical protein
LINRQIAVIFAVSEFVIRKALRAVVDEKTAIIFERMAKAQERIAAIVEKQNTGKFTQVLTTGATVATALGLFNVIDIIIKWIRG